MKRLTSKHARFAGEFLVDLNAAAASPSDRNWPAVSESSHSLTALVDSGWPRLGVS